VEYVSSYIGTWEAYDDQTGHFTAVQVIADATGVVTGSVTVDGHPAVSDDGQNFIDDGSLNTATIRDAAGAVVLVVPPGTPVPPIVGLRMSVGQPGFTGNEDATAASC